MHTIPTIMQFANSKKYLNLPSQGLKMYDAQADMLENAYQEDGDSTKYREIMMLLGRRSGKDFLCSIMVLYEAMRLLEIPGGPFKHYNISPGNPIYIMIVSASSDQSRIMLNEVKMRMHNSEFFKTKISSIAVDRIALLADGDKKDGSVVIMFGHGNSDGLLGKRIFALFFNDTFRSEETMSRAICALGTATADFKTKSGKLDSKIIIIGTPGDEDSIVYKMYKDAPRVPRRIAFKKATWEVNKHFTRESLLSEFKFMNDEQFDNEFGAEFRKSTKNQTVSVRLSGKQIEVLKKIAREQAFKQDREVSYIDLIREAVECKYFEGNI